MIRPLPPEPTAVAAHLRLWTAVALTVVAALALSLWLSNGTPAESSHLPAAAPEPTELTPPLPLVNATNDNPETAFPENAAGFSAYHRVPSQDDTQPRLDIPKITGTLLSNPGENNKARSGPGQEVGLGANFAIIDLPMFAAVGGYPVHPRDITVYYDDRGWIVAYLSKDDPAAAIWRYDKTPPDLEDNLLALAINEVLKAAELSEASSATVGYYDWQNPDCNAFVLFSNKSSGGDSEPVNFVIPPNIAEIHASAAVLITSRYSADGPEVSANVTVDGGPTASANATALLDVKAFDLERTDAEDGGYETSLHKMAVSVGENDKATGVVMLLYSKPD